MFTESTYKKESTKNTSFKSNVIGFFFVTFIMKLKDNVNNQTVNTKYHDYDDNQTWTLSKKIHEPESQFFKF